MKSSSVEAGKHSTDSECSSLALHHSARNKHHSRAGIWNPGVDSDDEGSKVPNEATNVPLNYCTKPDVSDLQS